MGSGCAGRVGDETVAELCRLMRTVFASRGLDLFENVSCGDGSAAFALSTDDCCFLVDRVRDSLLRDHHVMTRMVKQLAEEEPGARVFGILLVGSVQGIPEEFLRFGKRHNITLLEPDKTAMADFIGGQLEKRSHKGKETP